MTRFLDWLAFRAWLLIPLRWNASKLSHWLLPYAGRYAYSEPVPSHWGQAMRRLWYYLQIRGLRLGGVTNGDEPATAEKRATVVLASLQAIERGECRLVADIGGSNADD